MAINKPIINPLYFQGSLEDNLDENSEECLGGSLEESSDEDLDSGVVIFKNPFYHKGTILLFYHIFLQYLFQ